MQQVPAHGNEPSSHNLEAFLAEVEREVGDSAQVFLFSGDYLRLDITLLRHPVNPRVIWGLKAHEDWAFKATLLRFARGLQPAHVLLSIEAEGEHQLHGWVVRRTMDDFWAAPLPDDLAEAFWRRCGRHAGARSVRQADQQVLV